MHRRGASFLIRTQASCWLRTAAHGRGCMRCVGGRGPAAPARQAAVVGEAAGGSGRGTLAAVRLLRGGGCWRSGAARARIAIAQMWRPGWLRRGQRRCGRMRGGGCVGWPLPGRYGTLGDGAAATLLWRCGWLRGGGDPHTLVESRLAAGHGLDGGSRTMAASTPGQGRCDWVRGWSGHVPAAVARRAAGQRWSRHGSASAVGSTATSAASGGGLCRHHLISCALLAAEGSLAASQGQHGGDSTTRCTARDHPLGSSDAAIWREEVLTGRSGQPDRGGRRPPIPAQPAARQRRRSHGGRCTAA